MKSSSKYRLLCALCAVLYIVIYTGQHLLQERIEVKGSDVDIRMVDTNFIKTKKGYYTPKESIIENNLEKIEHVISFEPEYMMGYLESTYSEEECLAVWRDIQTLSEEICDEVEPEEGVDLDYLKIQALTRYVAFNIYYDWDAFNSTVDLSTICLKNVLTKKRTTCAGFSNLLAALCEAQGYSVINVRGSALNMGEYNPCDLESTPTNHEWVGVYYADRIIWIDITWMSTNRFEERYYTGFSPRHMYFDMDMEFMSVEHRIDRVENRNFAATGKYLEELCESSD